MATQESALQYAGQEDIAPGLSVHDHVVDEHDCVWLERRPGQASTIDRHTYCQECGAVRQLEAHGRSVSFFIQGVANLVEDVRTRRGGKITQAEARLMMKAVSQSADLNDNFFTTIDIQFERFSRIIMSFRPGLSEEFLTHSLFRKSSGKKK